MHIVKGEFNINKINLLFLLSKLKSFQLQNILLKFRLL